MGDCLWFPGWELMGAGACRALAVTGPGPWSHPRPLCSPDGYLYEREAILEYILHQKKEIARQMKVMAMGERDTGGQVVLTLGHLVSVPSPRATACAVPLLSVPCLSPFSWVSLPTLRCQPRHGHL